MTRHLLSMADLSAQEIATVLDLAEEPHPEPVLAGRGVALLFEHPSARTRNAAELAVVGLGGHPVALRGEEVGIDRRETAEDLARTLGCYHALIAARVASHATLVRMADALDAAGVEVPVLNLLSEKEHPTQAVADLLTLRQLLGGLDGRVLAYVGDANNVCRSLIAGAARTGLTLHLACPDGYGLSDGELRWAAELGGNLQRWSKPEEAVAAADAVYTDVWTSMGRETEREARLSAFAGYAVDETLLAAAKAQVLVMHCLPAHRGEEISTGALEAPGSVVWRQAANRLHAIRGILLFLLGASVAPAGGEP